MQPAHAETCEEKFAQLLVHGNTDVPVVIQIEQVINGGKPTRNEFRQLKSGHWMTVMTLPENQPWTLGYNNAMFTSSDKGKTWKKIRSMDTAKNEADGETNRKENAKTIREASCGSEDLDGVAHNTVEATFDTVKGFQTVNRFKYWVHPTSGWISKATYEMKGTGFESVSTQFPKPEPDLKLPMPD